MDKLEEIRNELKEKLEQNIQHSLDKLTEFQRDLEWRFLQPHIHTFNQKYLNFQLDRRILYWSFRQKRARYEMLKLELKHFIDGLAVFVYHGKDIVYSIQGDNNIIINDIRKSKLKVKHFSDKPKP